jgi:hypothetical protein
MTDSSSASRDDGSSGARRAGAFDVRTFIGTLIGLYGLIILVTGLVATSDADLERAGGMNINVAAGIGMIVVAAAFLAWARLRPVVVPPVPETGSERARE